MGRKRSTNGLGVLVAALNGAIADRLIPVNPAAGVERLPLGHIERDWPRLHEIGHASTPACLSIERLLSSWSARGSGSAKRSRCIATTSTTAAA